MSTQSDVCTGGPNLIFACSGAADVGAVADQAARKVTREGAGKMFCLAGIGGRIEPIMRTTRTASAVVAVDGCPLNCVAQCLKEAGFQDFEHVQLGDLGMTKGKTEPNMSNIGRAAQSITDAIAARRSM